MKEREALRQIQEICDNMGRLEERFDQLHAELRTMDDQIDAIYSITQNTLDPPCTCGGGALHTPDCPQYPT